MSRWFVASANLASAVRESVCDGTFVVAVVVPTVVVVVDWSPPGLVGSSLGMYFAASTAAAMPIAGSAMTAAMIGHRDLGGLPLPGGVTPVDHSPFKSASTSCAPAPGS